LLASVNSGAFLFPYPNKKGAKVRSGFGGYKSGFGGWMFWMLKWMFWMLEILFVASTNIFRIFAFSFDHSGRR